LIKGKQVARKNDTRIVYRLAAAVVVVVVVYVVYIGRQRLVLTNWL